MKRNSFIKTIKYMLFVIGLISTALGLIGMFVPLLPTTPFLILAAYCFARSSKRLYLWLITNPWCGEYIRNYREGRGILLKHKILTILLLWLSIGYSVVFVISNIWIKILLLFIAISVCIHLIRLKTFKRTKSKVINKKQFTFMRKYFSRI